MIIGLTGQKGSGKDTVGAYLIKEHGFERRSFADPLKRSLAAFLDIPFHEIENWKNNPNVYVTVHNNYTETITSVPPVRIERSAQCATMSFRSALQRYGTEAHRDIFGQDFWVDATLPVGRFYGGRSIVVTDCRFLNEAHRIRELGGKIIRVDRPGLLEQDPHSSEQELLLIGADAVITNDSSILDLYERTERVLDGLLVAI